MLFSLLNSTLSVQCQVQLMVKTEAYVCVTSSKESHISSPCQEVEQFQSHSYSYLSETWLKQNKFFEKYLENMQYIHSLWFILNYILD